MIKWIDHILVVKTCNLKVAQKLHSKINDLAQMMPFVVDFRFFLLELLQEFSGDEHMR